jgi:hypothetical protein
MANSYFVWHNIHLDLLGRARYIDLQAIDQKPIEEADVPSLRRSILAMNSAEKNWQSDCPRTTGPPLVVRFDSKPATVALDQAGYITKFTSKHLLVPMADGTLLGWNMKSGEPAGEHQMEQDSVLIDLAQVTNSRSLMGLIGRVGVVS